MDDKTVSEVAASMRVLLAAIDAWQLVLGDLSEPPPGVRGGAQRAR